MMSRARPAQDPLPAESSTPGRGIGRAPLRGLVLGALAGAVWALVAVVVHHAAGSVIPDAVLVRMVAMDVAIGAVGGLLVALVVRAPQEGLLAVGIASVYGFVRIFAPPGLAGEVAFVPMGIAATALGVWLLGQPKSGLLVLLHASLLTAASALLAEVVLEEAHTTLHGPSLLLAVAAVPLAGLLLDRIVALAVHARGRRLLLELAVGAVAAWVFARPLDTTPLSDPVVTAVAPPAGTPDVIVVSLDTTRADHLSTYGYGRETSPSLTAFASDALLFEEARSTDGWTLPAHASMLTGLYPSRHGARAAGGWLAGQSIDGRRNVAFPLPPRQRTLAEVLRDRGYHTGAFVANFSYLYRSFGLAQGFHVYADAPWLMLRVRSAAVRLARAIHPGTWLRPYFTGHQINAHALAWLDSRPRDRPAFLFLNYMDAHPPFYAEAPYDHWAMALPEARTLQREDLYTHEVRAYTSAQRDYIAATYDGQVAAGDAALGELLSQLRARGRYENALIIVVSDHGTLLGDHDQVGHIGRMLYEGLLHVPLVVKFPGADRPRGRIATPVQVVDVFATAGAVAGVPLAAEVQGQKLPEVTHPTLAEEDINAFLVARYGSFYDRAIRVLVEGDDKLITTSRGERLLFDVRRDPGELHDRARAEPGRVEELARKLTELLPFAGPGHAERPTAHSPG
jgi:arylsulfatase A-like enzyme